MAITSWIAAGGDWEDPQYERAWDGPAISPAKGDLTLSSSIPTRKHQCLIQMTIMRMHGTNQHKRGIWLIKKY